MQNQDLKTSKSREQSQELTKNDLNNGSQE
jgi:hypothetical protein